jgi:hypothetical protein
LWGVAKKTVKVRIAFAWSGTDAIDVAACEQVMSNANDTIAADIGPQSRA